MFPPYGTIELYRDVLLDGPFLNCPRFGVKTLRNVLKLLRRIPGLETLELLSLITGGIFGLLSLILLGKCLL